ncbi:MAG: FAA hydrolase family protein [Burkholderiaceae bacterium]|jgi:fumarylpyruvate hydrolase|nr:FAA hydrolase family protein [Burkholderiaceae bacterium]NCU93833.1 FAA hydrolase family protein [Burkholderiaceae bacterium]NCV65302.1 FAA hydrolase family protein [Burkholderiaceae bacterium]NCZ77612.1 FAA hydrolase family protein [Burkholderiaceae bacterium]NDA02330.1 FAA hydrolase family protein [Burkholderiaceae bacterium]
MTTSFVIAAPAIPSLPVVGDSKRFPVNRIYCVGRNYADHAREMGHDPDREPPFFFMKPATAIVTDGQAMAYPALSKDVHHELEMVVAIGKGGSNISADHALDHVWGYGLGLDMTRRDLQGEAKKMGRPWDTGKAFDQSAPCSALVPVSQCGHLSKGRIYLTVNGQVKQDGDLAMMIWNVPETIAYLSTLFTLMPGDLIFSGTPAGVAAVQRGDVLEGHVDGLPVLHTKIV